MSVLSYLEFFDSTVDAAAPAPEVVVALKLAGERIDLEVFGSLYEQALARIAAHLLELRRRALSAASSGASGVGPVTSVRTGDLAVSWAAPPTSSAPGDDPDRVWYSQTDHGREYLSIRDQIPFTPFLR